MSGSESGDRGDRRNDERGGEPMSLLVRNLNYGTSSDEIKKHFNFKSDVVKDVYMPKDYQTGKPRGFAFVEFYDKNDAEEAMRELDGKELNGRDLGVIVAQQRRKTPDQMRDLSRGGSSRGGGGYRGGRDRSRSRSRSPPRRRRSRSRSPPRRERRRSRSFDRRRRSPSRSPPPRRSRRSPSPRGRRSPSPPPRKGRSPSGSPRKAGW